MLPRTAKSGEACIDHPLLHHQCLPDGPRVEPLSRQHSTPGCLPGNHRAWARTWVLADSCGVGLVAGHWADNGSGGLTCISRICIHQAIHMPREHVKINLLSSSTPIKPPPARPRPSPRAGRPRHEFQRAEIETIGYGCRMMDKLQLHCITYTRPMCRHGDATFN